ncbi:MAG: ribonuclease R [Crocinitomicaceae bacterium]|nr:ribonuclease R [Crocinitomicaceae bacterium]
MGKNKKDKAKKGKKNNLKGSVTAAIRKLFEKNEESEFTHHQICTLLDLRDGALRQLAFSILQELKEQNIIQSISHNTFKLNQLSSYVEGYLDLNARGAGFVSADGFNKDIYIAPIAVGKAIGGDKVKVRIIRMGKERVEGEIVDVIERERTHFVGTIQLHDSFAFLVPDNIKVGTDIFIPKEKLNGAKNGEKVLVKITVWPKTAASPYGEVVERLGQRTANDTEMISILVNQGIDYIFPQDVIAQSEQVTMELDEDEIKKRRDMRNELTFTIDPFDAKDFDDALSLKRLDNGDFEIGVHIADVSHYVQAGSPMDKEALRRSNSVYLVDRVVPMLPEQLSNFACSLRPDEDKYSFSVVFKMSEDGKIHDVWFGKTVIRSNRRFAYEEAQEMIEGKDGDYKEEILLLDKIAKIFRKKRLKNGALSIESEEVRFKLDEDKNPIEVVIKTSKDAHKLIEEFMLLANRHVAEFIAKPAPNKDAIPFVFRIHDEPDLAKIELFKVFIEKFGYDLASTDEDKIALSINALLEDIRYKNEYSIIQSMAIRSMAKAEYSTENIGHYGLAFDYYTHFTSPIRRYADLLVHRILFEELTTKKHKYGSGLSDVCKQISRNERKAAEAERESTKYFQTIFVLDKIGEEFAGTISGITENGMYVKMDENQCEGMVPMNQLPGDRYHFDAEKYRIVGDKTKHEFNLGDKVRVRIYEVSPRRRQIDLELVVE